MRRPGGGFQPENTEGKPEGVNPPSGGSGVMSGIQWDPPGQSCNCPDCRIDEMLPDTDTSIPGKTCCPSNQHIWQKCPVCEGRGVVPQGFYNPYPYWSSTNTTPDMCRTCLGKGII